MSVRTWSACLAYQSDGEVINLTLINLVLHVLGPMRERTLCTLLLVRGCREIIHVTLFFQHLLRQIRGEGRTCSL